MQQKAVIAGVALAAALGSAWLWSSTGAVPRAARPRTVSAAGPPGAGPGTTLLDAPTLGRQSGVTSPEGPSLPPAEASLRVRVVDRGSRRPLAGVRLVVYETGVARASRAVEGARGDLLRSPRSGADGRVWFDLPVGRPLRLAAHGAGAAGPGASLVVAPLVLGEERTLVVPLEARSDVSLEGVVVDRETGDPVAGAELRLRERQRGAPRAWSANGPPAAVSDERGRFSLTRPAGMRHVVQVDAAGYGPATLLAAARDGGAPGPRTVGLSRPASLELRVLGAAGGDAPLVVRLACEPGELAAGGEGFLAGPQVEWLAQVGPEGRATVHHLPADAELTVELLRGDVPLHRRARRVRLAPGATDTIELDLGRGLRLSGTLTRRDGTPVADQELWLVPADRPGPVNLASRRALRAVHARARTDPRGGYAFDDVAGGEWWIGPAPIPQPAQDAAAPIGRWFRVPREARALTLDLVAHPGTYLVGRVLGLDGAPAPHAALTYRALDGDAPVHARADEQGAFRLGPVGPGPHEVLALADRARGHAGSAPVLTLGGGVPIELRLRSGGTLRVSGLVEEGGRLVPVERAFVTRMDRGPPVLAAVQRSTHGDTALSLGPVEPGRYAVAVATRDGYCGVLEGVEVHAGEATPERLIPVAPGGRLRLHNRGEEVLALRVLAGSAVVEAISLPAGGSETVVVPPGDFTVEVEDGAGEVRLRSMRLLAGGTGELGLPLD